jgi:hypothetical protein
VPMRNVKLGVAIPSLRIHGVGCLLRRENKGTPRNCRICRRFPTFDARLAFLTIRPETRAASLPPPPLRLLPAGTSKFAGRDSDPLEKPRLFTAYSF